jgi:hypothetical protein
MSRFGESDRKLHNLQNRMELILETRSALAEKIRRRRRQGVLHSTAIWKYYGLFPISRCSMSNKPGRYRSIGLAMPENIASVRVHDESLGQSESPHDFEFCSGSIAVSV